MSWQDTFRSAPAAEQKETGEFAPLPTGTYTAEVTDARVDETGDTPRVVWEFTITGGEYTRRKVWQNQNLNETGIPWLKQNLQKLEEPCDNPVFLAQSLANCVGKEIDLYVKQKPNPQNPAKPYVNGYINGLASKKPDTPTFSQDRDFPF